MHRFANLRTRTARNSSEAAMSNEDPGAAFDAHVTHVPVMTGGHGHDEVRDFYTKWFIGRWPADVEVTQVSRTVGQGRVIDELIASFTHDVDAGVIAGRGAHRAQGRAAACRGDGVVDGKIAYEHIYWDHGSLLAQVGLIDAAQLPVTGAEQARKLRDPTLPSNELIHRGERRRANPLRPPESV
jgi:carboxymethylenebutenolidase